MIGRRHAAIAGQRCVLALVLPLLAAIGLTLGSAQLLQAVPRAPDIVAPAAIVLRAPAGSTTVSTTVRMQTRVALKVSLYATALTRTSDDPAASPSGPADPGSFTDICGPTDVCIDPTSVKIDPSSAALTSGTPSEFKVAVSAWRRPGIYDGAVLVLSSAAPKPTIKPTTRSPRPSAGPSAMPDFTTPQVVIPLRLIVEAAPNLTAVPGSDKVIATRVQQKWPLDSQLAQLFLPASERLDHVDIPFTNGTEDPQRVTITVSAAGQNTGAPLTGVGVGGTSGTVAVTPRSTPSIVLDVDLGSATPDLYKGALYVATSSSAAPQVIPIEFTVRQGPFWPLLLLIAGAIIGVIAKKVLGSAPTILAANDHFHRTQSSLANAIPDDVLIPQDKLALETRLPTIEDKVDHLDAKGAEADLADLDADIATLARLRRFERAHPGAFVNDIEGIRKAIYDADRADADTQFHALRKLAREAPTVAAPPPGSTGQPAPPHAARHRSGFQLGRLVLLSFALFLVATFGVLALGQPSQGVLPPPAGSPASSGAAGPPEPAGASGASLAPVALLLLIVVGLCLVLIVRNRPTWLPQAGFFGLRWSVVLLRVVLAAGAVIAGMELLYVNQVATDFAAKVDPVVQYVFWGIGADVFSRTVTNFAKPAQ
jgi:hypothetical protein